MAKVMVVIVVLVSAISSLLMTRPSSAGSESGSGPVSASGSQTDQSSAQQGPAHTYIVVARAGLPDAAGVAARDGIAYVTSTRDGLHVYDLADPYSPEHLAHMRLANASRVVVDGDKVIVAHDPGSVSIVDVSDPTSPRQEGTLRVGHPETALAATGGTGAAADRPNMVLFDYTAPASPKLAGSMKFGYFGPTDLSPAGHTVLAADQSQRLTTIDVTNPMSPTVLGQLGRADNGYVSGLSVGAEGSIAYVGERVSGTYFIPTHVPPTPGPSPTGPTPTPSPMATAPPGGGRFTVVDISKPGAQRELGSSPPLHAPVHLIRPDGEMVWVLTGGDYGRYDIRVLDVSDPAAPVPADVKFEPPHPWRLRPRDLAISGDLVLLAKNDEGLIILRRAHEDWQTPTPTATGPTPIVTPSATPTPDDGDWAPLLIPIAARQLTLQ